MIAVSHLIVGLLNMADRRLDEVRGFFAELMFAASGSSDPRLERAFDAIPREAFLGPGPWKMRFGGRYIQTPSNDPIYLYQNALIALDEIQGINNGEPFLHAAWLGAAAIEAGDAVTHIGAGTGYYSAIMCLLALPGGHVTAFEINEDLAHKAAENLAVFENVLVLARDATKTSVPKSDVIYVNAGVLRPPVQWLEALNDNGRLIFPWAPAPGVGIAVRLTRRSGVFDAKPLGLARFIPCVGATDPGLAALTPDALSARQLKSVHLTRNRAPDDSAIAIYDEIWFSNRSG